MVSAIDSRRAADAAAGLDLLIGARRPVRRRGGVGRTDGRARTSRGHGAGPVDHGDQSRSFLAPQSASTMLTQISVGNLENASGARSATTHRVVGDPCDASGLTSSTARTYAKGRTVANGLIFEGFPN